MHGEVGVCLEEHDPWEKMSQILNKILGSHLILPPSIGRLRNTRVQVVRQGLGKLETLTVLTLNCGILYYYDIWCRKWKWLWFTFCTAPMLWKQQGQCSEAYYHQITMTGGTRNELSLLRSLLVPILALTCLSIYLTPI